MNGKTKLQFTEMRKSTPPRTHLTHPLKREDLDGFVQRYNPENRYQRQPTWSETNHDGRWRAYEYEELINRGKASLDTFWRQDESLEVTYKLPGV